MDIVVEKFRRLYPDVTQVKTQFLEYDVNKDGRLSKDELALGMKKEKEFTKDQAELAFELADTNGDGEIDIREFIDLMFPSARELVTNLRKGFRGPEDLRKKFDYWDSDKDGTLTIEELKEAAEKDGQQYLSTDDINAIFAVGDIDLDGKIDFGEFESMMTPSVSDIVTKFRCANRTVKDVKKAFKKYDINNDGKIDKNELTKALTNYKFNFSDQEVEVIFSAADSNSDGEICYEEFMNLMCPDAGAILGKFRKKYTSLNEVKAAFKKFDKNRDGSLNKSEVSRLMHSTGHSYTETEMDAIMNLGDLNGDGELNLEEFVTMMSPNASATLEKIRQKFNSIDEVKKKFKKIDSDSDGLLSKDELLVSPESKFDEEEIQAIFELGDSNGDNVIDIQEFIAVLFPSAGEAIEKIQNSCSDIQQIKEIFRQIDLDNDGYITKEEMRDSSKRFSDQEVESFFALGDINEDGIIDLDEFIGVLNPSASSVINKLRSKYKNMNEVKTVFSQIDRNSDGLISKDEILQENIFNMQEVNSLFELSDSNKDGEIDVEEFIGAIYPVVAKAILKLTKDIKNVEEARWLFRKLDKDGDGLISQEEMRKYGARMTSKEIEAIFAIGDINNDGEIDLNEFINVLCPSATTLIARISREFKDAENIQEMFQEMDLNSDGKISKLEMEECCRLNEQEINAIFELGDADNDGEISLHEFLSVMQTSSPVKYKEKGEVISTENLELYTVGTGQKCIIWCHDLQGFYGKDRTRQLVDRIAEAGFRIIVPDFFGKHGNGSLSNRDWVQSVTNWNSLRDQWVENLLPWIRKNEKSNVIGVLGTGWGTYLGAKLSSYREIKAGIMIQPSISAVIEALGEDLFEVFEEVQCPQMVVTTKNDCPNEKEGGLAERIWKSYPFGKKCDFIELKDMTDNFFLEGDRSIEAITVQIKEIVKKIVLFFNQHMVD